MQKFRTRYVHKISSRETDTGSDVELSADDLSSKSKLASKLRRSKVFMEGTTVRDFRAGNDGRLVIFPGRSMLARLFHSVILTPV